MAEAEADESILVAIVEDEPAVAKTLRETIEEAIPGTRIIVETDFDEALRLVTGETEPEAFVLDWFEGNLPEESAQGGEKIWERIWKYRLVPVVIYSAHELHPEIEIPVDNPLLKYISKGKNSQEDVVAFLKESRGFILAMRETHKELNSAGRSVLLDIVPKIWAQTKQSIEERPRVMVRTARRRLAAALDEALISTGELLAPWEQYIYPVLGDQLLTGDIVQDMQASPKSASSFRLVLTPSCDLQANAGKPKVEALLAAQCFPIEEFLKAAKVGNKKKRMDRLPLALRDAQSGGFIALPGYADVIPTMAANLRRLELMNLNEIDAGKSTGRRYLRVLSIDSPFREQVTWAYLQITGRPGLPEREFSRWISEMPQGANEGD